MRPPPFLYSPDIPASVSSEERQRYGLPRNVLQMGEVQPDEHGCVIHLNSTWMDMIDCWYRVRGNMTEVLLIFLAFPAVIFEVWIFFFYAIPSCFTDNDFEWGLAIIFTLMGCAMPALVAWVSWKLLLPDFLYTHYPIRFNRKTRMVHVFRHNGPGGVLSVPWGDVFFYIGKGLYQKDTMRDLRGQTMRGDTVTDSFVVGDFIDEEHAEEVKQLWKFIVIYMEHGPQVLPADNDIVNSANSSLCTQFICAIACAQGEMPFFLMPIFVPLGTFTRWLMMKIGKNPVWPPEIEAESTIEPNDPHVWKEPSYRPGNLFKRDPEGWARYEARLKRLGKEQ
jgi:hypothetical protein